MDSHQYLRAAKDITVAEIPSELKPYTMAIGAVVILLGLLLAFQGKRTYRVSDPSFVPSRTYLVMILLCVRPLSGSSTHLES